MSNLEIFNNKSALPAEAEVVICLLLGQCVGVYCQYVYFSVCKTKLKMHTYCVFIAH